MKIKIEITIRNVDTWGIDWKDETEARTQLREIKSNIKHALDSAYIAERHEMDVEAELITD